MLTTKQPAQIAQTAFSHNIEYFCFLRCLLDRGRVKIVAFCIENNKNYTLTVEKYNISYQQIYSWVRKYEINGVEGLIDHRGKSKKQEDLTEADRLRMENKILQAKLKDQEMEIKLLKKLRELRGGGH